MDLLTVVDELTTHQHTKELVAGRTVHIVHDPLLTQLEQAIRENFNTTQGSDTSLKFTRGILDADALYLFTRIRSQITDWARMVDAPRRDTPAEQLRAWYVKFTEQDRPDTFHVRQLTAWASAIRSKLDPWDEWLHPDPCPNPDCPQGTDDMGRPVWWDRSTGEPAPYPVAVLFRRTDGARMVDNAHARCRACGQTWNVRELAWAMEHATMPE